MKMNMKLKYLLFLGVSLMMGCDSFKEVSGIEEVSTVSVNVQLDIEIENIISFKDLKVKFDNFEEDLHYATQIEDNQVKMENIIPGIYSITVSGVALDKEDSEYYISGSIVNKALYSTGENLNILVQGLKVSPLIFKEIYFAGSRPAKGGSVFPRSVL